MESENVKVEGTRLKKLARHSSCKRLWACSCFMMLSVFWILADEVRCGFVSKSRPSKSKRVSRPKNSLGLEPNTDSTWAATRHLFGARIAVKMAAFNSELRKGQALRLVWIGIECSTVMLETTVELESAERGQRG